MKLRDMVSGGDLIGTLREAMRDVLHEHPYLDQLAKHLAKAVGELEAKPQPRTRLMIDLTDHAIAAGCSVCSVCGFPAHASETDDNGRCTDCMRAAGEYPIYPEELH